MSSDEHWWSSSSEESVKPPPIKPTVKKKRKIKNDKLFLLTKDAILKELRERKQKIDNDHGDLIEKAFLDPDSDFNDYLEWKRKIIAKSNNIDDIILSIINLKDGLKNLTKLINSCESILNEYERMFVIQNRVWYGERTGSKKYKKRKKDKTYKEKKDKKKRSKRNKKKKKINTE